MFIFASVEKSQNHITRRDEYTKRLTSIERALKLQTNYQVDEAEYFSYLKDCVQPWSDDEVVKLRPVLDSIDKTIAELGIVFEHDIILVKTSGLDEWNSAYTRENVIYMPPNKIAYSEEKIKKLVIHELFHVLFRVKTNLQAQLLELVNFKLINEIDLPENLKNRKLTNPDGPILNFATEIEHENTKIHVVPIILLKEGFDTVNSTKDIMGSITFKLLTVEYKDGIWIASNEYDSSPVIDPSNVKGIKDRFGEDEQLDPNEILAEAFVSLVLKNTNSLSIDNNKFIKILRSK